MQQPRLPAVTAQSGASQRARARAERRCGGVSIGGEAVSFRVWAPLAKKVDLLLRHGDKTQRLPMYPERGFFSHIEEKAAEGQRYALSLDGGPARPDPCSLRQPDGVAGFSALFRPERFRWTDSAWKGILRRDLVIYELHVGTFTPEGTFDAIIPRLASLRELGITVIELMPVAQFPGKRNWGYDGVLPYATQDNYGGPEGLCRLVDAAHAAGLAVILDVVYNHFGPEHSYLHEFGPYFTDKYKTPWGNAINYDDRGCDAVRDYVVDNARMWIDEYHLDGLRLDAVHAIYDLGARHLLAAISEVGKSSEKKLRRAVHIIAESDLNDPRLLRPIEAGGYDLDAQWSDDFHHAVHAHLTGERRGYYSDYGEAWQVAKVLESPFLFAWEYSPYRGRKHGAPPTGLSGDRFIVCIQNHDQVGNRAKGDRLSTLVDTPAKLRLAASLMLLSPHLPMLFMGEEYGERRPFPFFCSFEGPELVQAVREGRRREFADFLSHGETVPDPQGEETFRSAILSWSWPDGSAEAGLRTLYRDLLKARREWSALKDFDRRSARLLSEDRDKAVLELVRGDPDEGLRILFNLTDRLQPLKRPATIPGRGWFSSEAQAYGGQRRNLDGLKDLLPFECIVLPIDGRR